MEQVHGALDSGVFEHPDFSAGQQAGGNLQRVAPHFRSVEDLAKVVEAIAGSAAPDMALNNLERYLHVSENPKHAAEWMADRDHVSQAVITLFAGSQFLSEVLIAQPTTFDWLVEQNALWSSRSASYYREAARDQMHGLAELPEQRRAISRWRRREMLRIGMRDLLGLATMEEVTRDISDLAQAIIQLASELTYTQVAARFGHPMPENASWDAEIPDAPPGDDAALPTAAGMCVLGMGKLGGRELNFSSDIDLVFIYEAEGETTGRHDGTRRVAVITNHEFFSRMGEALVKFLAERGPDGNLFRVDMRLRPEGQDGPLVRSLESFVHYLSSQARDWERIAYLKARVLSGPSHLTERLYRVISRFVFAGVEPGQIIREIQELKMRIDREVMLSDLYEREVKRGYGGIREIEFVVAAMQIIHGYTHHALRVRNVFLAVQRLQEVEILTDEESQFYLHAYSFLRLIEHRLQMAEEHQTHTVPADRDELARLARRCGYAGAAEFEAEYQRVTHEVHRRFVGFFQEDVGALDDEKRDLLLITDRDAPAADIARALARRGLSQEDAVRLLHGLMFGTREVFISPEGQKSFQQMLPSLLRLAGSAPLPQRVLPHLHSFAMAMKGITYYYEVIAQHPEVLRLLVLLLGTSEFYSQALISHPEFFDALISSRVLDAPDPDWSAKRTRFESVFQSKLPQRHLTLLRRATHFENLLTVLRWLLKLRPLHDCLRELSSTADICLDVGMRLTAGRVAERNAAAGNAEAVLGALRENFAVLALGKYGGEELNFFGDLDVVFVFRDSEPGAQLAQSYDMEIGAFFTHVADTLNTILADNLKGGRAYMLDARLRPHGKNAPHATPLSQYVDYLRSEAQTWELQALTRARVVWGNSTLLEPLSTACAERRSNLGLQVIRGDVLSMRHRLEIAQAEGHHAGAVDLKRSPGGLVDVEFLLQWLCLSGQGRVASNYFDALGEAELEEPLHALRRELYGLYRDLREVECAIRVISDASTSELPQEPQLQEGLARLLGYSNPKVLETTVAEQKDRVRGIFDYVFSRD